MNIHIFYIFSAIIWALGLYKLERHLDRLYSVRVSLPGYTSNSYDEGQLLTAAKVHIIISVDNNFWELSDCDSAVVLIVMGS